MDYSSYLTQIASAAVTDTTDVDLVAILPMAIEYAEQRIYRDLDMFATQTASTAYTLTSGNRNLTIANFIVTERANLVTPAGTTDPASGARVPLTPVSPDFLDTVYGSISGFGTPIYWALRSPTQLVVGPWPNANFTLELIGTTRPAALSASNTTTPITAALPDLFFVASMVFVSGWQKNFGSQADNPQQAQSWEMQYQALLASARMEESRKRLEGAGWSGRAPAAAPPRA